MKTLDLYKLKSPCRPCICGADGRPVDPSSFPKLRQHRADVEAFWGRVFDHKAPPVLIAPTEHPGVDYAYNFGTEPGVPVQPYALATD